MRFFSSRSTVTITGSGPSMLCSREGFTAGTTVILIVLKMSKPFRFSSTIANESEKQRNAGKKVTMKERRQKHPYKLFHLRHE